MYFAGSRVLDIMIAHYTRWHDAIRSSYYCELNKLGNLLDTATFDQVMVKLVNKLGKKGLVVKRVTLTSSNGIEKLSNIPI